MQVKQIYEIVNTITTEVLGKSDLVKEDLTGIVSVGEEIFNANAVENYTKALVDHIGRMVFVSRVYGGSAPSVLMDAWEFGSVLEKVSAELPDATENETWELQDGAVYEQDMFYKPKISVKFFNDRITFEVPISITDEQLKSAFSDATQLNSFLSMIYNEVDKTLTIKIDSLIMRTINNFIGETLKADAMETTAKATAKSTARVVNLLYLYNQDKKDADKLTKTNCLSNRDFLRFASMQMKLYVSRLRKISTMFNIGGKARFTPNDLLHFILLENFASASETYLSSDTFHNDFVSLPKSETVAYWQGSGTDYSLTKVSSINIKTSSGNDINIDGIIGVMFDRDALGVTNLKRNTTSHRNNKAEFTNFWYKYFAGYFNDFNENFVVFMIA